MSFIFFGKTSINMNLEMNGLESFLLVQRGLSWFFFSTGGVIPFNGGQIPSFDSQEKLLFLLIQCFGLHGYL